MSDYGIYMQILFDYRKMTILLHNEYAINKKKGCKRATEGKDWRIAREYTFIYVRLHPRIK